MKRIITTIIAMVFTMFFDSGLVFAAPETMPDGSLFDPNYYAEENPDVVSVFGTDENMLYQHYVMCGRSEGRLPVAPVEPEYKSVLDYSPKYTDWIYVDSFPEGLSDSELFEYLNHLTGADMNQDKKVLEQDILKKVGITKELTEREIVRKAHDYLCQTHTYGHTTTNIRGEYLSDYVCHNYSKDFYDILAVAGLQVEYITGETSRGWHAWNRVYIDGEYRYFDVTWDDCWRDGGNYSDPWYMVSYDQISKDHYTQDYIGTP